MNGGRGLSKSAASWTSSDMVFDVISPANGSVVTVKHSFPECDASGCAKRSKNACGGIIRLVQRANDMLFMTNFKSLAYYASASCGIYTMFLEHFDNCGSFIATLCVVKKVACSDGHLLCQLRLKVERVNV